MSGRAACLNCGQPLDRHAPTCPRCGAAQPHKRLGGTVGLVLMLGLLALTLLWMAARSLSSAG